MRKLYNVIYLTTFLLGFFVLTFSSPVGAWEVGIEKGQATALSAGPKNYRPASFTAVTLRYGETHFVEAIQGAWTGEYTSRFAGLSYGYRTSKRFFVEPLLGWAHLFDPNTPLLDGNEQFLLSLGVGFKYENLKTILKIRHFSNANTQGKNIGFEVYVLNIGIFF